MPQIEIIVSPTGETQVETKGYTGGACRAASEFIERALGPKTSEQLTSEFYQSLTESQVVQEGV